MPGSAPRNARAQFGAVDPCRDRWPNQSRDRRPNQSRDRKGAGVKQNAQPIWRLQYVLPVLVALASASAARGEVTVPPTQEVVVDRAGVIDPQTRADLTALLIELRAKTGAEVKVLTVPTTGGEDFFGWTQRHYDLWKLGRKDVGDGAIIALAADNCQVRIQTGYGLEPTLPDSWCGTTSRAATAYFRKGDYAGGLRAMAAAVAQRVAGAQNVTLAPVQRGRGPQPQSQLNMVVGACSGCFVPALFIFIFLMSISRRRRHYTRWGGGLWEGLLWGAIFSQMGGGRRSHWGGSGFGGGGFGGGGFGGGGFGGGGFFGGGGMSGGGGGGASW